MTTSLPLATLNAMYNSRQAMINLASGETEDPAQSYAVMQSNMETLRVFGDRMNRLSNSFNDADYFHFWNQLASFGSLYQINTGTLGADQLRNLERQLWSFKNDVRTLDRGYRDYLGQLETLMATLGEDASVQEIQQYVPLVNSITEKTVELDVLIKDFGDKLFGISRLLGNAQFGG